MELNLRKARKLEGKIQEHLDSSRVSSIATLRVLGTLEEGKKAIEAARLEAAKELPVRASLLSLRYDIRRQIEMQNEKTGINALINGKVLTDALSKDLVASGIVAGPEGLALQDTWDMQVAQYNAPVDQWNRHKSPSFNVNAWSKADADEAAKKKLEYKKSIEAVEDKIGELNIIGKVKLSDDAVKLLQSVGLL